MEAIKHIPRLVVLELTRRCALSCLHCRAESQAYPDDSELRTAEWLRVIDEIASFARPIIIFSGGEALLREDIFEIISNAVKKGLTAVIATCGLPMTEEVADKLKGAGIKRVSISIDGKDALTHDALRGQSGAFQKAVSAMRVLKDKNIEFQMNTTVTKLNVSQLEEILQLAQVYGAKSFHPFFLVPVGRASLLKENQLSAEEYEAALTLLFRKTAQETISFRPTCAPQYFRILSHNGFQESDSGLDAKTIGCLAGKSFCFISHQGKVFPCGFLEQECGDIKIDNFVRIWQASIVFNNLRDPSLYKGKCGDCKYVQICGGCRARAYEATGNYLEEEPECLYQPLSVKS